jgi:hypothetical protein
MIADDEDEDQPRGVEKISEHYTVPFRLSGTTASSVPVAVFFISNDPVGRKSFLCSAYLDFSLADHFAQSVLQPIFRLTVPRLFYASSRLRPEIGWVVRAAKTKWNKGGRSRNRGAFLRAVCIQSKSYPAAR